MPWANDTLKVYEPMKSFKTFWGNEAKRRWRSMLRMSTVTWHWCFDTSWHSVANHSASGRVTQAPKALYHLPITNFHSLVELSLVSEVYCLWDKIKCLFYSYPLRLSPASSPSLTATKAAVLNLGFLKRNYANWKLPNHFQIFTFLMAWLQSIMGFIKWDLYKGWEPLQYAYLMNHFRVFQRLSFCFFFFLNRRQISTWLFLNLKFCRGGSKLGFPAVTSLPCRHMAVVSLLEDFGMTPVELLQNID